MSNKPMYQKGDRITLTGLSTSNLNGKNGIIISLSDPSNEGRYGVRVDKTRTPVAIKPKNIILSSSELDKGDANNLYGIKMTTILEQNCLPMCSLCSKPSAVALPPKKCLACNERYYCNDRCQAIDWSHGSHNKWCGTPKDNHLYSNTHQSWCAYLDRNPELDNNCLVEIDTFKYNPSELITTGMNTCFFVVIKTTSEIVGWHASVHSLNRSNDSIRHKLKSISKRDFVAGFIIPGEDRDKHTLDLKPLCRTMREMPWTDPSSSRTLLFNFLKNFVWYEELEIMPPVTSYKNFVVFDMAHIQPYTFSDVDIFNAGCSFDAGMDDAPLRSITDLFGLNIDISSNADVNTVAD